MNRLRLLPAVAALALVTACAPPAPVAVRPDADRSAQWLQHRAAIADIAAFTLSGRLSTGGIASAQLHWRQDGERFSARASGPFGSGAVALSGTPSAVRIRTGEGTIETDAPGPWMQRNLGWQLPIGGLRYWAIGLPMPGAAASYSFNADGRLAELTQGGWTIAFIDYTDVDGTALPARMRLSGDDDLDVLLRVDRWQRVTRGAP
ncbi:lipoprotein insertase outer membrane protein LolB [Algiphilus sp.]|uniref:lipoprotein insertase outer membrane protein LolB n=1 Tax=Algiphilus sp. TaxID=1872431 RepID=UPI003C69C967